MKACKHYSRIARWNAYLSIIAIWEGCDEAMGICQLCTFNHILLQATHIDYLTLQIQNSLFHMEALL
jgi:hypothetical protein